jgi:hypothetical protein
MSDDQPRQAAASPDTEYSLSIEEVAARYDSAGLPRDRRTIQRYCAKGSLDCHRVEIPYGEKYLVTPASVETHIAYIKEVRQAAAGRDKPRSVATSRDNEEAHENRNPEEPRRAAAGRDEPRLVAADIFAQPYVKRLEGEVDRLNDKLEQQVRRTEDVLQDANKRLIELQQANAIAQSETLAKYMLQLRAGDIERRDQGSEIENRG